MESLEAKLADFRDAMTIKVRIDTNYGVRAVYPNCAQSRLLAQLAGTRTLTSQALKNIKALGYQIEVYQPVVTL